MLAGRLGGRDIASGSSASDPVKMFRAVEVVVAVVGVVSGAIAAPTVSVLCLVLFLEAIVDACPILSP